MTHRDRQGVRCIEVTLFNFDAKGLLDHSTYLLFGGGTIAADGDLGFSGRILGDFDAVGRGCDHRGALGPAEFEDDLRVFVEEWRLDRHMVGVVALAQTSDELAYAGELGVRVFFLADVEHAHILELWLAGFHDTDDPETKQIGSGIDSEYGAGLSQCGRSPCRDGAPQG